MIMGEEPIWWNGSLFTWNFWCTFIICNNVALTSDGVLFHILKYRFGTFKETFQFQMLMSYFSIAPIFLQHQWCKYDRKINHWKWTNIGSFGKCKNRVQQQLQSLWKIRTTSFQLQRSNQRRQNHRLYPFLSIIFLCRIKEESSLVESYLVKPMKIAHTPSFCVRKTFQCFGWKNTEYFL